jgi:hypothetical protein
MSIDENENRNCNVINEIETDDLYNKNIITIFKHKI